MTNSMCTSCHSPSTTVATNIPHSIKNITNCLECHGPGKIVSFPTDHNSYDTKGCLACHDSIPRASPYIIHQTAGYEDCLSCHGSTAFSPVPADHTNRTNNTAPCVIQHCEGHSHTLLTRPRVMKTVSPVTDHLLFDPAPVTHTNWPNSACVICHTTRAVEAVIAPHSLTLGNCVSCHGTSTFSPIPASHTNWPGKHLRDCSCCQDGKCSHRTPFFLKSTNCINCHGRQAKNNLPGSHEGCRTHPARCAMKHRQAQFRLFLT